MPIEADKKPPESKNFIERITDFSGGLNTSVSPTLLKNNEAAKAQNVSYVQRGTLSPRKGSALRYSSNSLPSGSPFATPYSVPVGMGVHVNADGESILLASNSSKIYKEQNILTKVWDSKAKWEETGYYIESKLQTDEAPGKLKNAYQYFQEKIYTNDTTVWKAFNTATPLVAEAMSLSFGSPKVASSAILLNVPLVSPDVTAYAGVSLASLPIVPADDVSYFVVAYIRGKNYTASMGDCKVSLCLLSDFDTPTPTEVAGTVVTETWGASYPTSDGVLRMLIPKALLTGVDTEKYGIAIKLWDSTGARTAAMQILFTNTYAYKITEAEYTSFAANLSAATVRFSTQFEMTLAQRASYGYKKKGLWVSAIIDLATLPSASSAYAPLKVKVVGAPNTDGMINVYSYASDTSMTWNYTLLKYPVGADGYLTAPTKRYVWIGIEVYNAADVSSLTFTYPTLLSLTPVSAALSAHTQAFFASLNGTTVITNGIDTPLQWNGTDLMATPIAGAPPMSAIVVHKGRLWGIDTTGSSRVVYSDPLDPLTYDPYSVINFNANDGDRVVALIPYGQNLIVAKQRSMAMVTGDTPTNFNVVWLDTERGAVGSRAVCVTENYLVYVSSDGVHITDLSKGVIITEKIQTNWDAVNKPLLSNCIVSYWREKIYVALPATATTSVVSGGNDTMWVYDILRSAWSIYNIPGYTTSMFIYPFRGTELLLRGSTAQGHIFQMETGTVDQVGGSLAVTLIFEWRSKSFHFDYPERYKLFRNIFIDVAGVQGEDAIEVDIYIDNVKTGTFSSLVVAGAGKKSRKRILPPIYGAVLGVDIALVIRTSCSVEAISIEYALRGLAPGGDV